MIELLAAFVKFALYAGCLASAGTALAATTLRSRLGDVVARIAPTIRVAAVCALAAAIGNILVLVMRLGGDFSEPLLAAILESPPAPAAVLQIAGALVLILFAGGSGPLAASFRLVGACVLLCSFGVNGHAPSVDLLSAVIAFFHVTAAAWWLGALLLLAPACATHDGDLLVALVQRFSAYAIAIVTLLAVAGTLLVLTLVNFSAEDWFTPYAQVLTLKIVVAVTVLSLAAYNKFKLTPLLADETGAGCALLRQSIGFELLVIAGVLGATAILTTYTSPHS